MTIAILIHALVFLVYWLTNLPFQKTLNDFLNGATGLRANFLLIFMLFAGLVALWSALRLKKVRRTGPAWLYLPIGIFFLVFFYGSFVVLFMKNPVQLYRLGQLFQYFRLATDAAVLLLIAWGLRRRVWAAAAKKVLLPAGLLVLWLVPVFWTPGNVYRGTLPGKPGLIAHRGAATLAPENTLASMQAAVDVGVYGLETDIDTSADGVLFLIHDSTLARTTDVAQLFPGRQDDPVRSFTWDELSRLDAGRWFDASGTYAGESIPTLAAMLQVVEENGVYFIYDLRIPPAGSPYADRILDMCLEAIGSAGIVDRTWILTQPDEIDRVLAILPEAILARGIGYTDARPAPAELVASGYRVVNSAYGLSIRKVHAYQEAGLWVNLWVVDEPWQYARLWLAGADSVTSNRVQVFADMSHPFAAIPYWTYLAIWGAIGLLAGGGYLSAGQIQPGGGRSS